MYVSLLQELATEPVMHFQPGPMPSNHQNLKTHKPMPLPSLLQHQEYMRRIRPKVMQALPNLHISLSSIRPLQMPSSIVARQTCANERTDITGASHFFEVNIKMIPSTACHTVQSIKLPSDALHKELNIYFGSRSLPEFL